MLNEFYAPFILFYVAGEPVTSRRRELRPSPGSPGTPANASCSSNAPPCERENNLLKGGCYRKGPALILICQGLVRIAQAAGEHT